jgi:predicted dehydrogenase
MAMSSKECDDLIKISQETGSGIMISQIFRFYSAENELKRMLLNISAVLRNRSISKLSNEYKIYFILFLPYSQSNTLI